MLLGAFLALGCAGHRPAEPRLEPDQRGPHLPLTDPDRRWTTRNVFPALTFQNPTAAVMAPRRPGTWFIAEREGRIFAVSNREDATDKRLVLDLRKQTLGWQDLGLLNLVFHPDFGRPGSPDQNTLFVWYNYTPRPHPGPGYPRYETESWTRLSRFALRPADGVIDPASERVMISQRRRNTDHMGGGMFFHPGDGFLYLGIGDGGLEHLTSKLSGGYVLRDRLVLPSLDGELTSGVVRLDVDRRGGRVSHPIRRQPRDGRTEGYYIPSDNPWVDRGGGALEEFYAVGLRNPHRMTYDATTDRIFAGDVGEAHFEEVNLITRGGNYQWNYAEGDHLLKARPARPPGQERSPFHAYPRRGFSAVIGGPVYRGRQHPELTGKYLFADSGTGEVQALDAGAQAPARPEVLFRLPREKTGYGGLSSFALDENGEVYLCILGDNDKGTGTIQKLVRLDPPADRAPPTLSATGLFADLRRLRPAGDLQGYQINHPFWSDYSAKQRWLHLPAGSRIGFDPQQDWTFPAGTILVKHFEMGLAAGDPDQRRRLETRVLVLEKDGNAYGRVYKWRDDQTDADLITDERREHITATSARRLDLAAAITLGGHGDGSVSSEGGERLFRAPAGSTVFLPMSVPGDFDVALLWKTRGAGEAGILLRADASPEAPALFIAPDYRRDPRGETLRVEQRGDGAAPAPSFVEVAGPWLRLARQAGKLRLYSGRDGHLWVPAPLTLPRSEHALLGPALRSGAGDQEATLARMEHCEARDHLYPAADACLSCHNRTARFVLGLSTRQWNRTVTTPKGEAVNQLVLAARRGLFDRPISAAEAQALPRLAAADDPSAGLNDRFRSYLDVNCGQCHRPGVVVGVGLDARFSTPLADQGLILGHIRWPELASQDDYLIAPRDLSRSRLFRRFALGEMPPLGGLHVDPTGLALMRSWIQSLDGRDAAAPVRIETRDGAGASVTVLLESQDADARLYYTIDDTPPDETARAYRGPFTVKRPAVVRAIAYRAGHLNSRASAVELLPLGPALAPEPLVSGGQRPRAR
jgi:glucose/arabinose dehydrogenase